MDFVVVHISYPLIGMWRSNIDRTAVSYSDKEAFGESIPSRNWVKQAWRLAYLVSLLVDCEGVCD